MSNSNVDKVVEQVSSVFTLVDQVLQDWKGEGNLQFPVFFAMLQAKLGWDEKKLKDVDPLIRYYVRNSEDWSVTRGARGGIVRASDKRKKLEAQQSKYLLKKKMKEKIEAKASVTSTATASTTTALVSEQTSSQDDENHDHFHDEDDEDQYGDLNSDSVENDEMM